MDTPLGRGDGPSGRQYFLERYLIKVVAKFAPRDRTSHLLIFACYRRCDMSKPDLRFVIDRAKRRIKYSVADRSAAQVETSCDQSELAVFQNTELLRRQC